MQKTELLLKNNYILLLLVMLNTYVLSASITTCYKKDTTLILAYEICTDSTIFNCWAINHGEYNLSGLIIYDSILKKIKYEEGYFIYQSQYLNSQVVDSLIFLNLKAYKQDYSSLVWGNTVQIPFDSILRSEFAESNSLLIRDNKLTKVLRKEKRKKFIMNKYAQPNNIIPSNYKITGDKLFYLFKLNIEYQTSDRYFADRMIVTSNGRIKQIKIPYYYITRINSLEQFIPSK